MVFLILLILAAAPAILFLSNQRRRNTLSGKIVLEILIALGMWIAILIWFMAAPDGHQVFGLLWIYVVPYGFFLFMLNLYWLIPQTEKKKKNSRIFYLLRLIPLILLFSPLILLFYNFSRHTMSVQIRVFSLLAMTGISISLAWFTYQQTKERIEQLASLRRVIGRSTADLRFLRSQVNPHFLFNALNTLYGMAIKEEAVNTGDGIQRLGDMMRFLLRDNQKEQIPLSSEIRYIKDYIYLQQLRLSDSENIRLSVNIQDPEREYSIAPMLLIPFVENAFKHGIRLQENSVIDIALSVAEGTLCGRHQVWINKIFLPIGETYRENLQKKLAK